MAGNTQEVRTIMYSVVSGAVVTHRLPFNANDPIGRLKLQKFLQRGFTFDDPRGRVSTGLPQVVVTQEVDLGKPIDGSQEQGEQNDLVPSSVSTELLTVSEPSTYDKRVAALAKARANKKAKRETANA